MPKHAQASSLGVQRKCRRNQVKESNDSPTEYRAYDIEEHRENGIRDYS